ncbi:hypothetical protein BMS3Abin04_02179 [bacterium BMS3Abin04]|nr:hypothetical protein BMS3Abin04_02179 [bacterium BMS3Abin04]
MILVKIIKYQLHDVMRSKWIIFYTAFYFIVIYGMLTFTNDISKVLLSLMNVVLIIIPLISTILGTIYFYNNRDYIVFMLSQPINRTTIFLGLYFGLAIPLILSFVVGVVLGIVVYSSSLQNYFGILLLIMLSGIFLTVIFTAISFWTSIKNEDRLKGFGAAIFIWLFLALLFDGILLFLIQALQDYPLETFSLVVSMLNPIDLARVLILLKFDIAALMGYTGAVFQKFFGNTTGMLISFTVLTVWAAAPLFFARKKFLKKDF